MKQLTNKQYEDYQEYLNKKNNGLILLPDTIRFICEANEYDAEKIGQHFLEWLASYNSRYPKRREYADE